MMNIAVVSGVVAGEIDQRTLSSGEQAWSFDLKTGLEGAAGTVPISWVDPPARTTLSSGDEILVVGHVQKRFFRVGPQTQAKTELLVHTLTQTRSRRRVSVLLGEL